MSEEIYGHYHNEVGKPKSNCIFCEQETNDNYIGGIWLCSKCYPKFKTCFEHYLPFTDEDKLIELLHEKRLQLPRNTESNFGKERRKDE